MRARESVPLRGAATRHFFIGFEHACRCVRPTEALHLLEAFADQTPAKIQIEKGVIGQPKYLTLTEFRGDWNLGDVWRYELKGSPILLGAMSAALNLETRKRLAGPEHDMMAGAGA